MVNHTMTNKLENVCFREIASGFKEVKCYGEVLVAKF